MYIFAKVPGFDTKSNVGKDLTTLLRWAKTQKADNNGAPASCTCFAHLDLFHTITSKIWTIRVFWCNNEFMTRACWRCCAKKGRGKYALIQRLIFPHLNSSPASSLTCRSCKRRKVKENQRCVLIQSSQGSFVQAHHNIVGSESQQQGWQQPPYPSQAESTECWETSFCRRLPPPFPRRLLTPTTLPTLHLTDLWPLPSLQWCLPVVPVVSCCTLHTLHCGLTNTVLCFFSLLSSSPPTIPTLHNFFFLLFLYSDHTCLTHAHFHVWRATWHDALNAQLPHCSFLRFGVCVCLCSFAPPLISPSSCSPSPSPHHPPSPPSRRPSTPSPSSSDTSRTFLRTTTSRSTPRSWATRSPLPIRNPRTVITSQWTLRLPLGPPPQSCGRARRASGP